MVDFPSSLALIFLFSHSDLFYSVVRMITVIIPVIITAVMIVVTVMPSPVTIVAMSVEPLRTERSH
jgi:hypothetical protein